MECQKEVGRSSYLSKAVMVWRIPWQSTSWCAHEAWKRTLAGCCMSRIALYPIRIMNSPIGIPTNQPGFHGTEICACSSYVCIYIYMYDFYMLWHTDRIRPFSKPSPQIPKNTYPTTREAVKKSVNLRFRWVLGLGALPSLVALFASLPTDATDATDATLSRREDLMQGFREAFGCPQLQRRLLGTAGSWFLFDVAAYGDWKEKCGVSFKSFFGNDMRFLLMLSQKELGDLFLLRLALEILIAWGCFTFCGTYVFGYGRSVFLCLPVCSGFGSQPGNTLSFQVISTDWSDFQSKKWLEEHAVPEKVPSPHKRHNPTLFGAKSLSQLPVPINKRSLQERYKSMGMKVLSFGLRYCCLYTSYSQYLRRWAVSSYNDLALHPFVAWLHWWKTETFWGIGWRFCSEVSNHHSKVGKHVLEGSTILAAGHWAGASLQKHARQNPNM